MSKVLLVEDDDNLREIYEARLAAEGYEIITAQNGEEALVVAKQHHPDLIISDVMMPRISGFEMLDILRNTDELHDIKVIMLTALGQAEDQARAGKLGADRYLVKSQVTLEDIVNNAKALLSETPTAETTPVPTPIAAPTQEPATPAPAMLESQLEPVPSPTPGPDNVVSQAASVLDTTPLSATVVTPRSSIPVADPDPIAQPFNPAAYTTVAEPVKAATAEASVAQSTAAEEATVETQIEDFANTSIPVTPQAETVVAPAGLAPVSVSAANDKVLAEAVDDLNEASTAPAATVVAPSEKVVPGEEASTTQPSPVPVSVPVEPAETVTEEETGNDLQPVAGKKVISPISDNNTAPSLAELLAKEEQKEELGTATQATGAPVVNGVAPVTSTPAPANPAFDPSSISL